LEKAGLVELSDSDRARIEGERRAPSGEPTSQSIEELLAETAALTSSLGDDAADTALPPVDDVPDAPPPLPADVAPLSDGELFAGRDLEQIYADAAVPPSPYPAEKLLRVLDGLAAMDEPMRRAAIDAMDAADDAWTLSDPLLDAERKVGALDGELARLDKAAHDAEVEAQSGLEAQDAYQSQATETIRAQMAELEEMLEAELRTVAEARANIQLELEQRRAAITREAARYRDEIAQLQRLGHSFPDADR
jgi:hypothetical protein